MTGKRISLTPRDLQLLAFLAVKKAAPIDVLGKRFFARHANTGADNKHPVRACARRLSTLVAHGYLKTEELREAPIDGTPMSLVTLTPKGATRTDSEFRTVHARHRDHHIATIRACEGMRGHMLATGAARVAYKLEHELIAAEYALSPPIEKGQTYAAFPDAELTVMGADGATQSVAIEYVTASYTENMIQAKHDTFGSYDSVFWVANCARAAARVTLVTGVECAVL